MQQSLFDVLAVPAEQLKYEAFKEANPWVMPTLTKMCYQLITVDTPTTASQLLLKSCVTNTQSPTTPVANSNSTTITALLWPERSCKKPMLDGFFSTRKSVADLTEDY
jgi:hypothetical protein